VIRDSGIQSSTLVPPGNARLALAGLLACFILVAVASFLLSLDHSDHRLAYLPERLPQAIVAAVAFSMLAFAFIFARFNFGYFVSFYFFPVVLGFILISWFTSFTYDHQAARISAAASFIAFLLSATFVSIPISRPKISVAGFERLQDICLVFCLAIVVIGATYNFRLVGLGNIYEFRSTLRFPAPLEYLIGIVSSSVLPFLFAAFIMQRQRWRVLLTLALLLLFYPITLTKTALFSPIWLLWLATLSRFFDARPAVILSLLAPLLVGVASFLIFHEQVRAYFEVVNFRMITTPASVLNIYNDYFSRHDLTGFCQVSLINKILDCPDGPPLGAILQETYGVGFLNASLFATEGIASVGLLFAPISAFLCGLVIAVGNCVSRGLPSSFVLLSSGVLCQYLLNVPLTTALVTHGAALLFLLWYLTPPEALRGPDH
jgi:hypothetical protein